MGTDARAAAGLTLLYAASALGNVLEVFVLDPIDGRLERVQRTRLGDGVTPLALDPRRRFLFAGFRGDHPAVETFGIDGTTGLLERIGRSPLRDPPMFMATDACGAFLLSASYAAASFSIARISAGGHVDPLPVTHEQTPPRAHAIRTDPTNRYAFVTALGGDAILQFRFDATTGRVVPNDVPLARTPEGAGPRHMAFHPSGDVLYVNGELDGSVRSYALDAQTGRLTPLHGASMLAARGGVVPWAAELAVDPEGRFLYASERRTSTLAVFDLAGEPGALARTQLIATEDQPRAFAIEPGGRFLLAAGERSSNVVVYAIDAGSGALEACGRYPVGEKPVWLASVNLPHS